MSDCGRSPSPSGPSGPSGSGRRPSQSPSRGQQGSPSRSTATSGSSGWTQGPGFDPARTQREKGNTRMELPPDAYVSETKKDLFALRGNKLNTEGKVEPIEVNQFKMTKFNFSKDIYQYEIILSPVPDKLGPVIKKILDHPSTKQALSRYKGQFWLFDGKNLAWAPVLVDRGELRFTVDLDEQRGTTGARSRDDSNLTVIIRQTTKINMSVLKGYLDHKTSFNTGVQEALNFIDHLVRQSPSQHMVAIKRNFYKADNDSFDLGGDLCVEVRKGTYASVRMSHNIQRNGVGLGYNIDVANTCFWVGGVQLTKLICNFLASCDRKWQGLNPLSLVKNLQPVPNKDPKTKDKFQWVSSDAFKQLRKLRKLKFKVRHGSQKNKDAVFTAVDFSFDSKYGEDGANAHTVKFSYEGQDISVYDYYIKKYGIGLRFATLPLIAAGKAGWIPLELAYTDDMQRYPFKLNPDQTAAMIKVAVTRPNQRRADIMSGHEKLRIANDPYLKEYGVEFEPRFTRTEARILPAPVVKFGHGTAEPRFAGRWDLRGKKFWKQNVAPLQNWGFVALERGIPLPALQQFASTFKSTFMAHGGKCTKDPVLLQAPNDIRFNAAEAVAWAHKEVTQKSNGYTQLIFCVLSVKNAGTYERLKKSADCRFGILTQVVLAQHVTKNQGQYHSNVCMKVNAKLGGSTACTPQLWRSPNYFPDNRLTMIIGVDVSHAAPGGFTPSMAAMTMSIDKDATRYAACAETNRFRTEMLTSANVHTFMKNLGQQWSVDHKGQYPAHVIYFRDGVSEGQFAQVMEQEIREIKNFFKSFIKDPKVFPKFTVIVATKRHHIRFFPQRGDRNGNPLPGTLVEKEVTNPFMWDFYLNSHVAIQGTSRPVHYHVIHDEMNIPANDLQKMIYHQCYSYARSTTPVSLHPAVYYAHLTSKRAAAHENVATSEGFRAGPKGHEMLRERIARGITVEQPGSRDVDAPPLLPLGGRPEGGKGSAEEERQRSFFRRTMWFI